MKLQQNPANNQFFLSLPQALVRAKGWKKQDVIEVLAPKSNSNKEGDLILRKKEE